MKTTFLDKRINDFELKQCLMELDVEEKKEFRECKYLKQLTLTDVVKSLPNEEEVGVEIKRKLIEINKDKPVPSTKHDLGYSNGYLECYDFMTK